MPLATRQGPLLRCASPPTLPDPPVGSVSRNPNSIAFLTPNRPKNARGLSSCY
uniref:Uncharacterized protein n=1 Tax=Mesocestoides corti TaxID=53468 RepID=A0A5K3FCJ1_MESCO